MIFHVHALTTFSAVATLLKSEEDAECGRTILVSRPVPALYPANCRSTGPGLSLSELQHEQHCIDSQYTDKLTLKPKQLSVLSSPLHKF